MANLEMQDLIGLTEEQAEELIAARGMEVRIMQREDQHFIVTLELRTNRVNLYIENGVVFKANTG